MSALIASSTALRSLEQEHGQFPTLLVVDDYPMITPGGTSDAEYTIVVEIVTSGGLGVGEYKVSTDGGSSFGADTEIPEDGTDDIGATGITITFDDADFAEGDTYTFTADDSPAEFGPVQCDIAPLDSGTVTDPPLVKTLQVIGTFTANVDLEGSLDNTHWLSLGQVTASGKISNAEAWRYLRPKVTDYETGEITAILTY